MQCARKACCYNPDAGVKWLNVPVLQTDVANDVLDGTNCVMLSGETATRAYPELVVQTMSRTCLQAESHTYYGAVFKLISNTAPMPMSPLESLASSAVWTANISNASLILVLTRGSTTARLMEKYKPTIPVITVVVPELKTDDNFNWTCSDERPARHNMIVRGMILMLLAATAKAFDTESTDEAISFAIDYAKKLKICKSGDSVVTLHRIGASCVIKILTIN